MKKWQCKICGHFHIGEFPPEKCPVCGVDSSNFIEIVVENNVAAQSMGRIIIIGNGAAGIEAARTIREHNKDSEINIFTHESYHFYSRIHLSSFIGGQQKQDDLFIYPVSWYEENNIQVRLDTHIIKILPDERKIKDADGNFHFYDRLILTTGAEPFVPKIEGINKKRVFTLRNLEDGLLILKNISKCNSATIIGGGILGIEAASSLNRQGLDVKVIERSDHIMSQQLDLKGAEVLQKNLEKRGISFYLSSKVAKILGKKTVDSILLNSREKIQTDLILVCTGIKTNIQLAREAGIAVNKGVLVDEQLRTNFQDIFAAGDMAEFNGKIFGIWPAAVEQGQLAAKNAMGIDSNYQGTLPLHILKVAGIDLTSLGQTYAQKENIEEIIHMNTKKGQYVKLIHDKNNLLGCIVLGITGISFRLEKLIRKKLPIKELLPYLEQGDWDILKRKKIK